MKTLSTLLMMMSCVVFAQGQDYKGKLFWVVETNQNVPDYSLVRFYDGDQTLVHEVQLDKRLDVNKRRDRKILVSMMKRYTQRHTADAKNTKSKSSL
jgi:hypothetical protein